MRTRLRPVPALALLALSSVLIACGGSLSLGFGDGDDLAPVVSLSASPTAVRVGGTIQLDASAADDHGVDRVQFFVIQGEQATLLATDTVEPYVLTVTAQDFGVIGFFARAFDYAGNHRTSNTVQVTVSP